MTLKLIDYKVHEAGQPLGLPTPGLLYTTRFLADGVCRHARRDGLEAFIPVASYEAELGKVVQEPTWVSYTKLPGLAESQPFIKLDYPKIPARALAFMLDKARQAKGPRGEAVEILFHLSFNTERGRWRVDIPEQERSVAAVKPVRSAVAPGGSYETALLEVHSHHGMQAFFSETDNRDEQGFRLYAVIGDIFKNPGIRLRVGIYGLHYELPASEVFELGISDPATGQPLVRDLVADEWARLVEQDLASDRNRDRDTDGDSMPIGTTAQPQEKHYYEEAFA